LDELNNKSDERKQDRYFPPFSRSLSQSEQFLSAMNCELSRFGFFGFPFAHHGGYVLAGFSRGIPSISPR
jgi:hypothetical protein